MPQKTLRFFFAAICGKITIKLLKLMKKNATNLPGSVVLTLCPDFLKYLEKPEKIIAVTGTNGKTTVSNMLLDVITDMIVQITISAEMLIRELQLLFLKTAH